jgi:hypothetical protein
VVCHAAFAGVNHVALTVTDLDVSERFHTQVLGSSPTPPPAR